MFKRKKEDAEQRDQKAGSINIIGVGTEIHGDLSTRGDVRIDGKITGEVKSKAKVVIGNTGEVIGDISSHSAELSGSVKGNIQATEILFLKATAKVHGNISANKLVVENGAHFTGHCQTGLSQTKSIATKQDASRGNQSEEKEAVA